jgi:hypothetical protein
LIVYSHRNSETDEDVIDSVGRVIASISGHHDWQLLECQGCKTVCLLSKQFFSEWAEPWEDPYVRTYFPPRNTDARAKPHWFDDLIEEPKLQGSFILVAYKQIYSLIESSYFIAAMPLAALYWKPLL